MRKRLFAGLIAFILILSVLPLGASAVTQDEEKQIKKELTRDYYRTLSYSGMESIKGYCGLLASWQLYFLGVNDCVMMFDGNQQYDYYCTLKETSGGHTIKAYSAKNYTLLDALNTITKNGTKDVYNVLVGFQWTETEAGALYGHALVLYAILDGMVYFTESFNTALGTAAGQPIVLSIADFAKFYDEWTRFEGAIVFGKKDFMDTCTEYACHMIAEASVQTDVLSLPVETEDESDSTVLRTVKSGERMMVTGLFRNASDEYYYRVDDCGNTGYVLAEVMMPEMFIWDQVCLQDLYVPFSVATGSELEIEGEVSSPYTKVAEISVELTSQTQGLIGSYVDTKTSGYYQLQAETVNEALALDALPEGCYELDICAKGCNYYLEDGRVQAMEEELSLSNDVFFVGKPKDTVVDNKTVEEAESLNGWFYRQGKLYYYKNSKPVTGWICYHGVDYYLQEDGSVTTGWAAINGKSRFFSDTGAMQTGWVSVEKGVCYLLKNGVMAKGNHTIKGQEYTFTSTGWLIGSNS